MLEWAMSITGYFIKHFSGQWMHNESITLLKVPSTSVYILKLYKEEIKWIIIRDTLSWIRNPLRPIINLQSPNLISNL